ncbi:MFS transporter [Sporolactobacillus spathodeae]|uniref:MFS family permease n=1 Tax=Sporolactobacillus spathodeae TaxID=1465502 RepID=A0ABS2Q6P5_9BACL|nr:MFS transporter [Sporolactobacillus spathodeae]MBM7657469.1 MFS family permease [Sporolactobacillus spathodeae]
MTSRRSLIFRFTLLLGSVFICGVAEGMLLPLLSSLLEKRGVSVLVNGLGTTALYLGMIIATPFMEKPMEKFGYKPFLFYGLVLIALSILLFPIQINLWFWFILRFTVGIGDSLLHFAAQTWIAIGSPANRRGRNIACYGLSFGLGIAVGPLLVRLLAYGRWVPFIAATVPCLLVALLMLLLKNERPSAVGKDASQSVGWIARYKKVIFLAWSGLVATFSFGFLDASMNNSFPIFALRSGYSVDDISILLPAFVAGGLLTQLPIGMLSDRIGRKILLPLLTFSSACLFILTGLFYDSFSWILGTFLLSGMLIGSLYSMSMSYVSDLLERPLLPLGNILLSIFYSIGCIFGPLSGSLLIGKNPDGRLFFGFSVMLLLITTSTALHQLILAKCREATH